MLLWSKKSLLTIFLKDQLFQILLENLLSRKYKQSPQIIPAPNPTHIEPNRSRELKYQPWDHNSFVVIWLKSTISELLSINNDPTL